MRYDLISVGRGIIAAIVPAMWPELSPIIGYALLGLAGVLILLGLWGFRSQLQK
jgi:hypothetical protein